MNLVFTVSYTKLKYFALTLSLDINIAYITLFMN